jgi:hypothetical protein
MYDVLEFSHKEISEILNITEKNSKVRLHRARKSLKKILEEKCTFEVDNRNVLVCEPVKKWNNVKEMYEESPDPKELLLLEGDMHRFDTYNYFGDHPEQLLTFIDKYL